MARKYTKKSTKSTKLSKEQRKEVKDIVEGKLDKFDCLDSYNVYASQSVSNTLTPVKLSIIQEGFTDGEREGDNIDVHAIEGHLQFVVADETNLVRCTIFQWYPDDAVDAPDSGKIYASVASIPTAPLSSIESDCLEEKKFRVLFDRVITLDQASRYTAIANVDIRKKLRSVIYNDGATTVTGKNQIYMFLFSDSSVASHPQVSYNMMTHFRR